MREEEKKNAIMVLANKVIDNISTHFSFNLEGTPAAFALSIGFISICGCIVLIKNGYPSFQKPIKYTLQNF
jgi:hypothetical protein